MSTPNEFDYETWIRIGFALYDGLGEDGQGLWAEWSATSSKNDPDVTDRAWPSFAEPREITIGTLFHYAREAGWNPKRGRPAKAGRPFNASADPSVHADEDTRPVVRLMDGKLPEVVDCVERLLIGAGAEIYVRGGKLVVPVIDRTVSAADDRETTSAMTVPLTSSGLADKAARVIRFGRYSERARGWVDANVPESVPRTLLERRDAWNFAKINGIATTPVMLPDGSILSKPGYDPRTRLYLAPDPNFALPPLLDRPDRAEAEAALALLDELLDEFPFVEPVDRSVALSGILTALVRGGMPTAPMHIFRAHTPGSGKSYLVDLICAIATGRRCPVIAAGRTEEETEKRLASLLLEGIPIISIDNLNGTLSGDTLCQMLTQTEVKVRILGKSEAPTIEVRTAMYATGNNLKVKGDMVRRVLLSTLDAGVERPEERSFAFKPIDRAMEGRGRYVAAAYTLIRAYMTAGSPKEGVAPFGSYEVWSSLVRGPLIWLGRADPVESVRTARNEDPDLTDIGELFAQWDAHMLRNAPYTSQRLIEIAQERGSGAWGNGSGSRVRPELHGVLSRRAGYGDRLDARRLGNWLSSINGRVLGGLRLEMKKDASHGNKFTLVAVPDSDGMILDVPSGEKLGPKRSPDNDPM
ncbi:PriCT-2 domain-containing protein [Methylorubrum extorquens]